MRLSVQLYTLRDQLDQVLAGTLREVRDIGLEFVELAGFYGRSAEEWKNLLETNGLTAKSAHIGLGELEHAYDKVVQDAKTLGLEYVIVPWIGRERYDAGWDKFGQELDSIGRRLRQDGLSLAYHNHDFEFVPAQEGGDGSEQPLAVLYAAASSDTLKAELDLAWIKIGGGDPAAWVRKLGSRAPLVHLKDYDPSQNPQWVPGGKGIVDWDPVLAACRETGVKFGVIELDAYAGQPIDAVRESFRYFSSKGLS